MCAALSICFQGDLFFLKDSGDIVLERMRDRKLNRAALVIQTFMKGRKDRCRTFGIREETTPNVCALAELCLSVNA